MSLNKIFSIENNAVLRPCFNPNECAEHFDALHLRCYVFDDPPMRPDALHALRWKTYVYPCLGSWHVLQQSRHVYHEFPEFYKSSEIYSWTSHTYVDFSTAPLSFSYPNSLLGKIIWHTYLTVFPLNLQFAIAGHREKPGTVIFSAAKQNDRLHESYLVQGMAKILLYNFVLLPNF